MGNGRLLANWLDSYLDYTTDTEPPTSYHHWVGIGLIASALQRKVRIIWGHERFFPNFYIVLVGPSGRCRKGLSMRVGRDLLMQLASVTTISEKITLQGLIRDIAAATNDYLEDGSLHFQSAVTIFSEELTVLLGKQDTEMLAALTDWFDSPNEWTYRTKQSGTDSVQGLCLNIIGATAPELLQVMLPGDAIGGGWSSRIIFVYEERKKHTVPIPIIDPTKDQLRDNLVTDLQKIHKMSGVVDFSSSAKELYRDWYLQQDQRMQDGEYPIEDHRFHYYCERRAMHVRKLSTILHIAHSPDLAVSETDMEEAIGLLTKTERKMDRTFGGFGRSEHGDLTNRLLNLIRSRTKIEKKELLRLCRYDMTYREFQEVMETLIHSGEVALTSEGDEFWYVWKGAD